MFDCWWCNIVSDGGALVVAPWKVSVRDIPQSQGSSISSWNQLNFVRMSKFWAPTLLFQDFVVSGNKGVIVKLIEALGFGLVSHPLRGLYNNTIMVIGGTWVAVVHTQSSFINILSHICVFIRWAGYVTIYL